MRIDLSRIRDIDRTIVLTILTLVAGIAISAWLVNDVSKREKEVDALKAEVDQGESQVGSLPPQPAASLTPAQLQDMIDGLVVAPGADSGLREELSKLADQHLLDGVKINYDSVAIDPASPEGENGILLGLGISGYTDITIDFSTDYQSAVRFMDAVEKLPQRMLLRTASLRRAFPRVAAKLSLRVYQKNS
jgi:hypothetical protein